MLRRIEPGGKCPEGAERGVFVFDQGNSLPSPVLSTQSLQLFGHGVASAYECGYPILMSFTTSHSHAPTCAVSLAEGNTMPSAPVGEPTQCNCASHENRV